MTDGPLVESRTQDFMGTGQECQKHSIQYYNDDDDDYPTTAITT
jgi:hypothetical protein